VQDRAIKAADVARRQRAAHTVPLGPSAVAIRPEAFAREGLAHHPQLGPAVDRQPDQRPPDGQATDERAGAVDRIEHPSNTPAARQPEFLAEDGMVGEMRTDLGADRDFRLPVRLGHGVEAVPLLHLGIDRDVGTVAGHRLGIGKVGKAMQEGSVGKDHDRRPLAVAAFAHSGTRHRSAVSSQKAAGRPMPCATKPITAGPARMPA